VITGKALRMRLELSRLAVRHQISAPSPVVVPLASPSDEPIVLAGFACTSHIDLERTRFSKHGLGWLPWRLPPLLYRHDSTTIAGTIDELAYTDDGALWIRCVVTNDAAKRCNAFSVAATIHDYELVDVDSPNFYAVVRNGWLDEISLTSMPANPNALVHSRRKVSPLRTFHDIMIRRVECLTQLVQLIERGTRAS
jgi:hypothetical protein